MQAPHNERPDEEKQAFYNQLAKAHRKCPKHDIRIVIGDLNAQAGREKAYWPSIGKFSLHSETNGNGLKLMNFAAAHSDQLNLFAHMLTLCCGCTVCEKIEAGHRP